MKNRVLSEIFAIICVGFAFSVFKFILGQFLQLSGYQIPGIIFITWGTIDIIINFINLVSLSLLKKRVLRICLFNYIVWGTLSILPWVDHHGPKDLGTAIDVFAAFLIVAIMVGGGFISQLTPIQVTTWNWSVVLNVLYAGTTRLVASTRRIRIGKTVKSS